MIDKNWFEMQDIRKRWFNNSAWVPLKASVDIEKKGNFMKIGYKEEYFGVNTLAIFIDKKEKAEKLEWTDMTYNQRPFIDSGNNEYIPSDIRVDNEGSPLGMYLVLSQNGNSEELGEWHLHQDFVLAFDLKKEGDSWVSINEGYIEVARLKRDEDGAQSVLEVRSEYLKEYLGVRRMSLKVFSYHSRTQIVDNPDNLAPWEKEDQVEKTENDRWEGRVIAIGENGLPYGSKTAILHVSRKDIDPEMDVPEFGLPSDDAVISKTWTKKESGEKTYRIHGALWRKEWVEPAENSPRIRGDKETELVYFITDASGKKETKETLDRESHWLWFKPEVVREILSIRGSNLSWYTKDTGNISCSPSDRVHFGINRLGLINVYAKDIGLLPIWQQKIWAGFNISPDGKVSGELLDSQMKAIPAKTLAPEGFLNQAYSVVNDAFLLKYGNKLFKEHSEQEKLLKSCHRFRSFNRDGLFSLAKDLNKLITESMDIGFLREIIKAPKGDKLGSIKLLEKILSSSTTSEIARKVTAPLVGINEMRQADSHLISSEIDQSILLAGINLKDNPIEQGYKMLDSLVKTLVTAEKIISKF